MTRKEERNDFIHNYLEQYNGDSYEASAEREDIGRACLNAIEWADKTMLDKVCKWLQNYGRNYAIYDDDKIMPSMRSDVDIKKLIKDLRNAIKD